MKIPQEKIKPFTTEIAAECSEQISALKNMGDLQRFSTGLDNIVEWCTLFGKTEMGRWVDVLNDCDTILATCTLQDENNCLKIDRDDSMDQLLISILRFTSLLFENTFSRSVYSSIEHLIKLLDSRKISIIVHTLRLLMVISKSSRFITQHLSQEFRIELYDRLTAILEIWSGLRNIKLTDFCSNTFTVPASFNQIQMQQEMNNYQIDTTKTLTESMVELKDFLAGIELQKAEIVYAFTKLRFAYSIKHQNERFYNAMARQIATSIIFYSRYLLGDESRLNGLANEQYIEQCCEFLHFEGPPNQHNLIDTLKTETLKTLASIVFLEKVKKIQLIVDALQFTNPYGFGPSLIRKCTDRLKALKLEASGDCSMPFITSLFSLIYHIAGFVYGGDALNHSSIIPTFLSVIKAHNLPGNYISYVTRSVRILDILTTTEVTEFNANDGTEAMINRFRHEINHSRKHIDQMRAENKPILCNQQRSALMKSLLNFLKRAVLDFNLIIHIRRMMGAELSNALKHIMENPKYYGSSLLHCAIALVTSFIYQEPAQLTVLQTNGLTDTILELILNEKFPISRDLLNALVNVCAALCLNERGLNELKSYNNQKPMSKIFGLIFSNRFLLSIRKRKSEILEAAHMLGTSLDELIRHQPTMRREVMGTIANTLESILEQSRKKDISISWSIGKCAAEDYTGEHLPLGDYLGMMGVMFETMLTNRGIQDNIVIFNEYGIPLRLVKILSQANNPNPILLNSNYLPNLANIISCVMRQINKVDDGFIHLVEACTSELTAYPSMKDSRQERLGQITRLSSLISIMNNLMKGVIHSQTYDIRPFLLHYLANDKIAQRFLTALFDTYKIMSSDKLLIAAQQTTTQILEDATKVQELLQINDPDNSMEVDDHTASTSNDGGTTEVNSMPNILTERSIQQVAYRCQRQISELIVCIGKNFCNANVTRVRQRIAQILQINQDTLKKDYREVSKQVFSGLNRLLQSTKTEGEEMSAIPATHITQSLGLLKKVLIDDQNIQQMLPDFYTSECHKSFFNLVNNSFKSNLTKEDYVSALHSWLNISQKLVSINLIDPTKHGRNGGQPQPPRAPIIIVNGFELKNYLATSQKDLFTALCLLLNTIIAYFNEDLQIPSSSSSELKEQQNKPYKLFEKLLETLKFLLKDTIKLFESTEPGEIHQEVPVNEIDPTKIQQLVEMGFSQSDALDALLQFSTIAEAAEYLVSQMERNPMRAHQNEATTAAVEPLAVSEQKTPGACASTTPIAKENTNPFSELKPLTKELLEKRMEQSRQFIFNGLNLMSGSRSLVNALAELTAIFGDEPSGHDWLLGEFNQRLKTELFTQIDNTMSNKNNGSSIDQFAATLHFFNLIRQSFPNQQIGGGSEENEFNME